MRVKLRAGGERFNRMLAAFMIGSKLTASEVMFTQAKGIIRSIISITPPASSNGAAGAVLGGKAKKAGESTVAADIYSLMYGVRAASKVEREDIAEIHANARSATTGRARGSQKVAVPTAALTEYVRKAKGLVGYLASGWKSAAAKFGITLPVWISKHNAPGKVRVSNTDKSISIYMDNDTSYGTNIRGLQRRVNWAVKQQAGKLERQIKPKVMEAARRAGLT